jgi:drug/metabolite transporter (DMT)-like permease
LAKWLLANTDPWLLAGLFYIGSGVGLTLYRALRRAPRQRLSVSDWPWFVAAIVAGGVVGPVLLMLGLAHMPASGAALLLNAEGRFTALLAWFAFRENVDLRIALGMAAIAVGAVILSWPTHPRFSDALPALAIVGACFAWGLDNNLTRNVALADATWIAAIKGLCAGGVNLFLALLQGAQWPPLPTIGGALLVGWLAYGVSLTLFVVGLRELGTARTGAYFSVAPFFGAVLAVVVLGDPISSRLLIAGALIALGVWLHLTEQHRHEHLHKVLEHEHEHTHDAHHQHQHDATVAFAKKHAHRHRHETLTHSHAHFPDAHHRHDH